ncbi:MAG: ABC transporter ATP-binding protein [Pseudomonadota bacterium]
MARLTATDLAVRRGGRRVVEPLSFALEPGTLTAICGPNGAGKSSLLMALAGLLAADAGEAALDGQSLRALPAKRRARAIGYLPQEGSLAWDIAVQSLVALGRYPHGDAESEAGARAVAAALADTGLEDLARRPVSQLSGGERARALLARVLAGQPQWILADEPLAALDLAHQLRMMSHLTRRAHAVKEGVVLVLHDLSVAMNHADRALVLDKGRLIADGPPEEALAPSVIERVWGVKARWLGAPAQRALISDLPQPTHP